ncbi:MAG: hypothetical protein ACRDQ5_20160 [Sciscionella sp.]
MNHDVTTRTDRAAKLAAEHGPALADLAGGELQRMYLAQLATLEAVAELVGRYGVRNQTAR